MRTATYENEIFPSQVTWLTNIMSPISPANEILRAIGALLENVSRIAVIPLNV